MKSKDPLWFNKAVAAVLATVLALFGIGALSNVLYHKERPESTAYVLAEGVEDVATGDAVAAPEALEPIAPLLAQADVARGETVAKKCVACHTFDPGGAHKLGPNLYGVVGQPRGSAAGFGGYSKAMKAIGGAWDYESLNKFLHKPKSFVKGTAMSFGGLPDPQDRADVVAYLRSLSPSPAPLP